MHMHVYLGASLGMQSLFVESREHANSSINDGYFKGFISKLALCAVGKEAGDGLKPAAAWPHSMCSADLLLAEPDRSAFLLL